MADIVIENLVSTMNSEVEILFNEMNLSNDAIFINQQKHHYYKEYTIKKSSIKEYGFNEKGVGLSRNSALERSKADICIMSDDDMVYVDNYLNIIKNEYKEHPNADMILFNVRVHDNEGTREIVKKSGKIHYLNSLKYGTAQFTFKREKVLKNNIFFSLYFGGGGKFSNGEDSIFLWNCLKAGLKIYSSSKIIADVYNYESSWFEGYNKKFFVDRGALFEALSPKYSLFLIYQYAIRKRKIITREFSVGKIISLMKKGRKIYRNI